MGTGKKEAARRERQGKADDGMGNVRTKGENFYRYVERKRTITGKLGQADDYGTGLRRK
jgi:nuclear GTP-binding protein